MGIRSGCHAMVGGVFPDIQILRLARERAQDTFTFMDLRLFMTLVRFDAVYVVYFKTNVGTIEHDYPNLLEYCRDVYQMPGMAKAGTGKATSSAISVVMFELRP